MKTLFVWEKITDEATTKVVPSNTFNALNAQRKGIVRTDCRKEDIDPGNWCLKRHFFH